MITGVDGDTIVEYKTGEPRPEHEAQSRLYALLWWHRSRRPVRQRRLLYADHEVVLAGLAEQELRDEAAALRRRVATARLDVGRCPPPARPATEKCRSCSVRQLCDDYWHAPETEGDRWTPGKLATLAGAGESSAVVQWGDLEIDLAGVEEGGDRFAVGLAASPDIRLLCPIPPNFRPTSLANESRVRLLGITIRRDGRILRVVTSARSEFFWEATHGPGPHVDGSSPE